MMGAGSRSAWMLLALWAALPSVRAVLAAESAGVVLNHCAAGPIVFAFSALPESCSVDWTAPRCPQSGPGDVTLAFGVLKAPGGIMDLGPLEEFDMAHEMAVPSAGYMDSVPFRPRHLYAMKVGEKGFALFAEVRNFIGGCLHQEFRWRYNDSGNHFSHGPVGVRPESGPRAGIAARGEGRGIDVLGRTTLQPRLRPAFPPGR